MPVDAKFIIKCGKRGSGKTNKTIDQLHRSVNEKRRTVLIFDIQNEFGNYLYRRDPEQRIGYKTMELRHVARYSLQTIPEIRRLIPFDENGNPFGTDELIENLIYVFNNYRNGVLLAEDFSSLITDSMPGDIFGKLCTLRQRGVDVVAHFQLVGKAAHPKIISSVNAIYLHKTEDSVRRYLDRFLEKSEIMMLAENIVEGRYRYGMKNSVYNEKGIYFNVQVDIDKMKIHGIFTKDEAHHCAKLLVDELKYGDKNFKKRDEHGNKKYNNYAHAFSVEVDRLMDDYFCF